MKKYRIKLYQTVEMTIIIEAENKKDAFDDYNHGNFEVESEGKIQDAEWDCMYSFYEEIEDLEEVEDVETEKHLIF